MSATLLPATAQAQWQWLDAQGRPVFSDRAPPIEVPEKNIVKRPAPRSPDASSQPAGSGQASEADAKGIEKTSATTQAPPGNKSPGADPELEARKAQAQAQAVQQAQQRAEAERQAQVRADNCVRARQAKANLDSGLPLMQINAQGNRVLMDEATKAAELQRALATIASDCPR